MMFWLTLRVLGGLGIEGEDESYDFGSGAGFYVDATREPWSKGYNMYSYIRDELPEALFAQFAELDGSRVSIMGHSMGGHGALTLVSADLTPHTKLERFSCLDLVSEEPWDVQERFCVRTDCQSYSVSLGEKGFQGVLWRGGYGQVERTRCNGARQGIQRSSRCAHRCGMSRLFLSLTAYF